jgi:hypothetical protein
MATGRWLGLIKNIKKWVSRICDLQFAGFAGFGFRQDFTGFSGFPVSRITNREKKTNAVN